MKCLILLVAFALPLLALADTPPLSTVHAKIEDSAGNPLTSTSGALNVSISGGSGGAVTANQGLAGTEAWLMSITSSVLPTNACQENGGNLAEIAAELGAPLAVYAASLPLPLNAAQESGGHLASIDSKLDSPLAVAGTLTCNAGSGTFNTRYLNSSSDSVTIAGSISVEATNPSVGSYGVSIPASGTSLGGEDTGGLLQPLQVDSAHRLLVDNSQVTQPVSGSLGRTWNLLNTTDSVNVGNFPSTYPVTGTFWQTTQPVSAASLPLPSGAATSANQTNGSQVTQVSNFPSTFGVTQSTSPWVVSGALGRTWDLSSGTDSVSAVQSGTWTVQQGGAPWSVSQSGTWTTGRTWSLLNTTDSVNVGNFPATQAISAASLPLPAGAATSANQTNGSQVTQVSSLPSIPAGSNTIGAVTQAAGPWTTNITQVGGGAVILGQTTMSNSIPITIASDQTGINTFQDKTASGSLAALNSTIAVNTNGVGSVGYQVTGTWSGTITSECTDDGVNWFSVYGLTRGSVAQSSTTLSANTAMVASVSGCLQFRLRMSSYTSGSATVTEIAGAGTGPVFPLSTNENNFIVAVGNFPTTQAISVASLPLPSGAATAANQTNGSQIVQVSSLPPIPTGSNTIGNVNVNGTVPVSAASLPLPSGAATATNQSSQITQETTTATNTTSILANQTNGTQKTQVTSVPSDLLPSVQTVTTQDIVSGTTAGANGQSIITGTPTANSTANFAISSTTAIEVQVTGAWTGTLESEVSMDGGTTWYTRGLKQTGSSYNASSFTANFEGGLNFAGMTNFRIRAIAAMTGTANIRVNSSVNSASLIVSNPITLRDSTVQSVTSTIKAASTPSTTSDTALVVAASPNSPLPAGTNLLGKVQVQDGSGNVYGPTQAVSGTNYMPVYGAALGVAGASAPARTEQVGGSDGTDLRTMLTDATGVVQTSLGNTNKSFKGIQGNLNTSTTASYQIIATYTVTAGKTFYLQYFDCSGNTETAAASAAAFGVCSLSIGGNIIYQQYLHGSGTAGPFPIYLSEPIPVTAGTVISWLATPVATTAFYWYANIGGYEK
jgi:hypothetical protein